MSHQQSHSLSLDADQRQVPRPLNSLVVYAHLSPTTEAPSPTLAWIPILNIPAHLLLTLSLQQLGSVAFIRYIVAALVGADDVHVYAAKDDDSMPLSPATQLYCGDYFVLFRTTELFPVYFKDLDPSRFLASVPTGRGGPPAVPKENLKAVEARDIHACQLSNPKVYNYHVCHLIPFRRGPSIVEVIFHHLESRFFLNLPPSDRPQFPLDHRQIPHNLVLLAPNIHKNWDAGLIAMVPFPNLGFDSDRNPNDYNVQRQTGEYQVCKVFSVQLSHMLKDHVWMRGAAVEDDDPLWPPEAIWSYRAASTFGKHFGTQALRDWSKGFNLDLLQRDERHTGSDVTRGSASRYEEDMNAPVSEGDVGDGDRRTNPRKRPYVPDKLDTSSYHLFESHEAILTWAKSVTAAKSNEDDHSDGGSDKNSNS